MDMHGKALADYAVLLMQGREEMTKNLENLSRELDKFTAWGHFDEGVLESLKSRGITVYLCCGNEADVKKCADLDGVDALEEVWRADGKIGFAVITMSKVDEHELPLVQMPEEPIRRLREREKEIRSMLVSVDDDLDEMVSHTAELKDHLAGLQAEFELLTARDTMFNDGKLAVIQGYVPADDMGKIEIAAEKEGWAFAVRDPEPEDAPPVLLKMPKWVRPVKPLFDFLGITPGYMELDVSPVVLIFFSIFFGMIVNDAGYGILFGALTAAGWWKFGRKTSVRPVLLFASVLSTVAVIWGALCGSWFGCEAGGLEWFTAAESKDQHVQLICFSLGLAQLGIARLWKACIDRSCRGKLGHLGWVLVLAGNFIMVTNMLSVMVIPEWGFHLMYGLYGAGILMVIIGGVNWLDIGDVFQFPFAVVNSFVDLLSYIRIFAVALAGYYIAANFNSMGSGLAADGWYLWLPGSLVIAFGHALNIALCMMSVLVHGVRLNTLEFSNHVGVTWTGVPYRPLAVKKENN
jgi:V/A-type H+-transporting ATPase subunit I